MGWGACGVGGITPRYKHRNLHKSSAKSMWDSAPPCFFCRTSSEWRAAIGNLNCLSRSFKMSGDVFKVLPHDEVQRGTWWSPWWTCLSFNKGVEQLHLLCFGCLPRHNSSAWYEWEISRFTDPEKQPTHILVLGTQSAGVYICLQNRQQKAENWKLSQKTMSTEKKLFFFTCRAEARQWDSTWFNCP